jgi:prepilin-type N-terminal cleavage/methylation domain-containing protein
MAVVFLCLYEGGKCVGAVEEAIMIFRLFHKKVIGRTGEPGLKKQRGLSILELMVVLGIISIIAAIGIPLFMGIKDKATVGTTEGNLSVVRKSLNNFMLDSLNNRYPVGPLDYTGLRTQIPFANLPIFEDEAKIQTGSFAYSSDGITFSVTANSTNSDNQPFTVTPNGIVRN